MEFSSVEFLYNTCKCKGSKKGYRSALAIMGSRCSALVDIIGSPVTLSRIARCRSTRRVRLDMGPSLAMYTKWTSPAIISGQSL